VTSDPGQSGGFPRWLRITLIVIGLVIGGLVALVVLVFGICILLLRVNS
jgi:hypothetical protein